MVNLSNFYPLIRPSVRGVPEPMLSYAVREAARRLCQESWVLKQTVYANITIGNETYDLTAIGDTEIIGIAQVQLRGIPLPPGQPEYRNDRSEWNTPTAWYFNPPTAITLFPTPNFAEANALQVRVAVQPMDGTDELDDLLYKRHRHAIAEGAKAWLHSQQQEAWANPQLAVLEDRRFATYCVEARRLAEADGVPGNLRIKPRRWAI